LTRHGLKHFCENLVKNEIQYGNEYAEQDDSDANQDGRTFQFIPGGPRAFAGLQFRPGFLAILFQADDIAFVPKQCEEPANDDGPNYYRYQIAIAAIHKKTFSICFLCHCLHYESWRRGRDSNPRWPLGQSGFQDRRDRPLCHLSEVVDSLWSIIDSLRFRRACLRYQPSTLNLQLKLARQEGIEPPTNGFGDRYSTN
jgi:hypothetical protein